MHLRKICSLLSVFLFSSAVTHAEQYMEHGKVMDGFVHVQKAPQMGRPMPYLPAKKLFHGKHHKKHKGKPVGEQKFGRGHAAPSPSPSASATPLPTQTASPTPVAVPVGTGTPGPSDSGTVTITPTGVDLRGRDAPIKDQIGPICTAYAGNAGIENLIGKGAPDLSEDYTFSIYGQYSVDAFAEEVPNKALALATAWPRGGRKSASFTTTNHKLITISYLGDGETAKAKQSLQRAHPVYLGLEVPSDMASCLASIRPTTKVTNGGHATLIVGNKDDASNPALGGGYWIVRNSWSTACGDKGYQYLPYSYCDKSYCYMYEMSLAL